MFYCLIQLLLRIKNLVAVDEAVEFSAKSLPLNKDDREQIVVGQLIAELTLPLNIDNFEGISTRSDVNGGVIIYLISDDNFNSRQRTLLMVFEFKRNERNLSKVIFSHY